MSTQSTSGAKPAAVIASVAVFEQYSSGTCAPPVFQQVDRIKLACARRFRVPGGAAVGEAHYLVPCLRDPRHAVILRRLEHPAFAGREALLDAQVRQERVGQLATIGLLPCADVDDRNGAGVGEDGFADAELALRRRRRYAIPSRTNWSSGASTCLSAWRSLSASSRSSRSPTRFSSSAGSLWRSKRWLPVNRVAAQYGTISPATNGCRMTGTFDAGHVVEPGTLVRARQAQLRRAGRHR